MRKFIALPDTWFDAGTEVELLADCTTNKVDYPWGIFRGLHNGRLDEETCTFDEFEIIGDK